MVKKVDKRNKKSHHRERVFEKNEQDFYNDFQQMEIRKKHKEIYGVESFEIESENFNETSQIKQKEILVIEEVDESSNSDFQEDQQVQSFQQHQQAGNKEQLFIQTVAKQNSFQEDLQTPQESIYTLDQQKQMEEFIKQRSQQENLIQQQKLEKQKWLQEQKKLLEQYTQKKQANIKGNKKKQTLKDKGNANL